jgi:hypothetical protein
MNREYYQRNRERILFQRQVYAREHATSAVWRRLQYIRKRICNTKDSIALAFLDLDADGATAKLLCRYQRGSASHEGVENQVAHRRRTKYINRSGISKG